MMITIKIKMITIAKSVEVDVNEPVQKIFSDFTDLTRKIGENWQKMAFFGANFGVNWQKLAKIGAFRCKF